MFWQQKWQLASSWFIQNPYMEMYTTVTWINIHNKSGKHVTSPTSLGRQFWLSKKFEQADNSTVLRFLWNNIMKTPMLFVFSSIISGESVYMTSFRNLSRCITSKIVVPPMTVVNAYQPHFITFTYRTTQAVWIHFELNTSLENIKLSVTLKMSFVRSGLRKNDTLALRNEHIGYECFCSVHLQKLLMPEKLLFCYCNEKKHLYFLFNLGAHASYFSNKTR